MKTSAITIVCGVLMLCVAPFVPVKAQTLAEQESVSDSLEINISEITVSASYLKTGTSPLRLATVDSRKIKRKGAGTTYPELLSGIPGIYATSESGSYGDARINIRGFKQENISVMLNGIPISGLVTGNMFWNNWLGLSDATYSIQVQKGIGASMLSDNSVGGTVNIITNTATAEPSVLAGLFYTGYGLGKSFVSLNSGQNQRGWAVSLIGSYTWGSGYVRVANVKSWAYMLNVSKRFNERHRLLLTVLGSPERHQQRSVRLSASEIETYGLKYNKNWGYLDGKPRSLSENFYHKPYITLSYFMKAAERISLTNTLYLSVGDGGGNWSESKGKRIIDYRKDGQIDWNAVVEANKASGEALNILSVYLAGHTQSGFKSQLEFCVFPHINLQAGVHYQHYSTWEKERITDLLGGNYWYEDYAGNSLSGMAGRNPVKKTGDYIRTYNGKIIDHVTGYLSGDYLAGRWNLRGGISLMWNSYRRWDKYNYVVSPAGPASSVYSPAVCAAGFSAKGGALYKLNRSAALYLNTAIYSRLPYANVFFAAGTNDITSNVKNEKNVLVEAGYRFTGIRTSFEATAYYAYWKNKTLLSDPYKQQDNSTYQYMVQGLDALHYGIEVTAVLQAARWLRIEAGASFGNWTWKNDVSANIYDPYSGILTDHINVYCDGLRVGDSPHTQCMATIEVCVVKGLYVNADWNYNGRIYADFDPAGRIDPNDRANSLQLPDYHLINMSVIWRTPFGFTLLGNLNNLTNQKYIERGKDGADHTSESFRGYWGFGINGSLGLRINIFDRIKIR